MSLFYSSLWKANWIWFPLTGFSLCRLLSLLYGHALSFVILFKLSPSFLSSLHQLLWWSWLLCIVTIEWRSYLVILSMILVVVGYVHVFLAYSLRIIWSHSSAWCFGKPNHLKFYCLSHLQEMMIPLHECFLFDRNSSISFGSGLGGVNSGTWHKHVYRCIHACMRCFDVS